MNIPLHYVVRPGIVHFMAFPATMKGEGPILETCREILADDFVLANTIVSLPLYKPCNLAAHLYGDWATAKTLSPFTGATGNWHNYFGVGAGLSFRAPWDIDVLLGYGYGINAVRHVTHGGHEISLALEKKF